MADPYAEFGGSTLQDPYAEFGGSLSVGAPPMPKAPIPAELQPEPTYRRVSESVGQGMLGMFAPMGQLGHDINQAMTTGDWKTFQKKYPPWEASDVWSGIKDAASNFNPGFHFVRDDKGDIKWPETLGENTGVAAVLLAPFHEHLEGLPENLQNKINDVRTARATAAGQAAQAAATAAAAAAADPASQLTFAQRHPELVKKVSKYVGGGIGGAAGGVFGPSGATAGAMGGAAAAESFAKRFTAIPPEIQAAIDEAEKQAKEQRKAPAPATAPTTAAPAPAAPTPAPGDWLARQYGYANEADAVGGPNGVGQAVWDNIKARGPAGVQQGRPVGAPPPASAPAAAPPAAAAPVTAPPAPAEAPAAVPATATAAAPTPSPEAAAAASAEAPTTTPTAKAAREPLKRGEYPNEDEIARAMPGFNFQNAEEAKAGLPEGKWLEYRSSVYSSLERARAKFEGRPVKSDLTELQKRGVDTSNIKTYDQAQEALRQSEVTEQLRQSVAQTPEAAPTPLDNMRSQIQQADIAPEIKAKVQAGVESAMERGDARTAQQLIDEAMPEAGRPSWRQDWQQRWQQTLDAYDAKLAEMGTKRYAGFDPKALPELTNLGRLLLERGVGEFDEWSQAMLQQLGNHVRPYLQQVWQAAKAGASETLDYGDNISTRMPKTEGAGFKNVELVPSENPYTNQLHISGDAVLRRDPDQAAKLSDAVQGNTEIKEPLVNDRKQDGTRRYATPEDFQEAHDQWEQNMKNQYVGVKIDPAIANDPAAVFKSFSDQVKRNLIKLYNFVPDNIRQISSQWYDTARGEIAQQAATRGLENRQVAAVYASLSPQKDWFMNRSLANRLLDIWDNQQNATFDDLMRDKVKELTAGGKNAELKQYIDSGELEDKTFSEMSTDQKAAFARIYDEAHNDRSYNGQSPDGQDLGPVQKKGKIKGTTENAKVAWGSLDEMGKAISALEDGSLGNVQQQLLGTHKVPNFYNNILTPNHPGEYVTIDTHAVAAGLLRPLSQKALEVAQNFGGFGSVRSGAKGTYALYADAYRDAAAELGIQPRQLQSITWEAIRDIFPKEWKANPANVAKINDIWRQFENGDASFDQTFDKILEARGGKDIDWSAGKRSPVYAEEDEAAPNAGELRQPSVPRGQEAGRPNPGRELNAPRGTAAQLIPGATTPLRRALQPSQ